MRIHTLAVVLVILAIEFGPTSATMTYAVSMKVQQKPRVKEKVSERRLKELFESLKDCVDDDARVEAGPTDGEDVYLQTIKHVDREHLVVLTINTTKSEPPYKYTDEVDIPWKSLKRMGLEESPFEQLKDNEGPTAFTERVERASAAAKMHYLDLWFDKKVKCWTTMRFRTQAYDKSDPPKEMHEIERSFLSFSERKNARQTHDIMKKILDELEVKYEDQDVEN